jgi:hypothetical protein
VVGRILREAFGIVRMSWAKDRDAVAFGNFWFRRLNFSFLTEHFWCPSNDFWFRATCHGISSTVTRIFSSALVPAVQLRSFASPLWQFPLVHSVRSSRFGMFSSFLSPKAFSLVS